jgi:hypothetical protein
VQPVDPALHVRGNRELLLGRTDQPLQNAFKFTRPLHTVTLSVYAFGDVVWSRSRISAVASGR